MRFSKKSVKELALSDIWLKVLLGRWWYDKVWRQLYLLESHWLTSSKTALYNVYPNTIFLEKPIFKQKWYRFLLISSQNICWGCSLEAPHRGASNEYHNIGFYGEIKKKNKTFYLMGTHNMSIFLFFFFFFIFFFLFLFISLFIYLFFFFLLFLWNTYLSRQLIWNYERYLYKRLYIYTVRYVGKRNI